MIVYELNRSLYTHSQTVSRSLKHACFDFTIALFRREDELLFSAGSISVQEATGYALYIEGVNDAQGENKSRHLEVQLIRKKTFGETIWKKTRLVDLVLTLFD